jgi:hypothetical protein
MSLPLRVLKRYTSLEETDFEIFFKAEFHRAGRPDLDLSIFDIAAACVVQTHAECVVSWLDPPLKNRGGLAVDGCSGTHTPRRTPAETEFAYTKGNHLELGFLHEEELRAFARHAFDSRAARDRCASREEVRTYGRAQLAAGDREWEEAIARKPKWAKELER